MLRINRLSVISVFCFLWMYCLQAFSEEAMVISVIGQAWVRGDSGSEWGPLVRGDMIVDGQEIKFKEESLVRAVTSTGELKIVKENGPVLLEQKVDEEKRSSPINTLNDFVKSGGRSREAATRTIDSVQADNAQHDWVRYIQDPPKLGEIEDFLSLIDYYETSGQPNRRWALLQRLSSNSGSFVGFSQLNSSFEALNEPNLNWHVIINSGTKSEAADKGSSVVEGDGIQIKVESDQEVFVYVFFTTKPNEGEVESFKLSPQNIAMVETDTGAWEFAGLLAPEDKLALPNPNQSYRLDSNPGYEYIWGWACLGPVVNKNRIDQALSRVKLKLASTSTDIASTVEQSSPEQCPYVFSLPLEHK